MLKKKFFFFWKLQYMWQPSWIFTVWKFCHKTFLFFASICLKLNFATRRLRHHIIISTEGFFLLKKLFLLQPSHRIQEKNKSTIMSRLSSLERRQFKNKKMVQLKYSVLLFWNLSKDCVQISNYLDEKKNKKSFKDFRVKIVNFEKMDKKDQEICDDTLHIQSRRYKNGVYKMEI